MASKKSSSSQAEECPWESGKLGLSLEHARPASPAIEKAVDDALGLQLISIRFPKGMIEDLKFLADREGLGYQPLIRRVMQRYILGEFKAIARDAVTLGENAYAIRLETPQPVPRKAAARPAANAAKPGRKRKTG